MSFLSQIFPILFKKKYFTKRCSVSLMISIGANDDDGQHDCLATDDAGHKLFILEETYQFPQVSVADFLCDSLISL